MEAITGSKNNPIPSGKRCDNKAIIVLLGLTGAGKTSTLNFLFNRENMIKTESWCSQTLKIMEYITKIRVDGSEYDLKIIDTPGFGDTISHKPQLRDAQCVATLDSILKKHEDLKSCYPTAVLLVAKFNDDRIEGETSHFIQMLKAIDAMLANWRLIDKKAENTNLIFVLTHTMSVDSESLRANPTPKIQLIECLVRTFTQIPTPINVVMAENKPELHSLPKVKDFYRLPNGDLYPANLFKKIQAMTYKANDVVGETLVREAFKNPEQIRMILSKEHELFSEEHMVTRSVLEKLQSAKFNIENNQISQEIRRRWDLLDKGEREKHVNSLEIMQSTFHRHGIFGEDDVPQSVDRVLKLIMDLPTNPSVISVLDGMGIVGPELPRSLCVGNFYNVFGDCPMLNSPFSLDAVEYTNIGFRAPRGIEAQRVQESLMQNSFFTSPALYYEERLTQLSVEEGFFSIDKFTDTEPKTGYNIIPRKGGNVVTLSGVKEYRRFQVYLKHPTISASYRIAASKLPPKFIPADADRWSAFFTSTGTHVLDSVYAGGGVEVVATKRENLAGDKETAPQNVLALIGNVLNNVGMFNPMDLEGLAGDWEFRISFRGGNPSLVQPTLNHMFRSNGVKFFKAWLDSLSTHPALLHSELELACVTEYLMKTKESAAVAREMRAAMAHLYATKGETTPTPSPTPSPSPTTKIAGGMEQVKISERPTTPASTPTPKRNLRNQPPEGDNIRRNVAPPPKIGWTAWFKQKLQGK